MAVQKFRKLPVVIEAIQYNGSTSQMFAIKKWIRGGEYVEPTVSTRDINSMYISTLEGEMEAKQGDWIVRGISGECYPVKPDIFEKTYECTELGVEEV